MIIFVFCRICQRSRFLEDFIERGIRYSSCSECRDKEDRRHPSRRQKRLENERRVDR